MNPKTKTMLLIVAIALCPLAAIAILAAGIALPKVGSILMFGLMGMAVTANQLIKRQDGVRGHLPVAASTRIYEGTLVFINATGYGDDDTASGVNEFGGIAIKEVDNSGGSAGDLNVELWRTGVFELTGAGTYTQADVGKTVYASDNFTITLTGGGSAVEIGTVARFVSATVLGVDIKVPGVSSLAGDGSTFAPFIPAAAQQALSGAGAINITTFYTAWTTTGANAGTLANGVQIGQLKKIQQIVDGGDGTLTPVSLSGGTTITFADAGDYALLMWNGTAWVAIELGNAADGATAPVLA